MLLAEGVVSPSNVLLLKMAVPRVRCQLELLISCETPGFVIIHRKEGKKASSHLQTWLAELWVEPSRLFSPVSAFFPGEIVPVVSTQLYLPVLPNCQAESAGKVQQHFFRSLFWGFLLEG